MSFTIENSGFKGFSAHVSETVRVAHEGEVNKARYMPQDPMIIGLSSELYSARPHAGRLRSELVASPEGTTRFRFR